MLHIILKSLFYLSLLSILIGCDFKPTYGSSDYLYEDSITLELNWVETKLDVGIVDVLDSLHQIQFNSKQQPKWAYTGRKYWLKIKIDTLGLKEDEPYVLELLSKDACTLYYSVFDSVIVGERITISKDSRLLDDYHVLITKERASKPIYLNLKPFYNDYKLSLKPILQSVSTYNFHNSFISYEFMSRFEIIHWLFAGAAIMIVFYFIGIYIQNPKREYLIYISYVLCLFIYLIRRGSLFYIKTFSIYEFGILNQLAFNESIQVLFHALYLLFALEFLNAKKDYPIFYKWGKILFWILIIYIPVLIFSISMEWSGSHLSFLFEQFFMTLMVPIGLIYFFFKRKDNLPVFIVVGSVMFSVGAVLALLLLNLNYMKAGSIIEMFFFSLGLGYKIKQSEKQKLSIQQNLVEQLKVNDALQRKNNEELKKEVEKRSQQIIAQELTLAQEKKKRMEITLNREIDRVKMIALRTQMNPHFLFNSLNSIRALIIHKQNDEAYKYLTKFSRMIRNILDSSEKELISLKEEIEVLKLYVSLEQMRFSDGFDFHLEVDESIDTESMAIPPLILQPFIENAILHGLALKEGEKHIRLSIRKSKDNKIRCILDDNGVGREYHKNLKKKKITDHNSMAISLTYRRLDILSQDIPSKSKPIKLTDLYDDNNQAQGTRVDINIPLIKLFD